MKLNHHRAGQVHVNCIDIYVCFINTGNLPTREAKHIRPKRLAGVRAPQQDIPLLIKDVVTLDKEHRWRARGQEALYVQREKPTLNRGGGLRH